MLFGDMFKRQKPRGLTWTPRYSDPKDFDPEDDAQFEELRRQSRIAFNRLRTTSKRRRGANPFVLLAFIVMVGAVIMVALREPSTPDVREVQIQKEDAPTASQATRGDMLIIERDTVKTDANDSLNQSEVGE